MYPSNFRKNIRLLVCTPAHLRLFPRENFLGFLQLNLKMMFQVHQNYISSNFQLLYGHTECKWCIHGQTYNYENCNVWTIF